MKNKTLKLTEYIALVEMISEGYFDTAGEFQPQWGELNAIRLFYNFCIDSKDNPVNSLIGDEMQSLLANKKVIDKYYNEVSNTTSLLKIDDSRNATDTITLPKINTPYLSFGNAYLKAMEVVETRKSSIGTAINIITSAIKDMSDGMKNYMTQENLSYLATIAKEIKAGSIAPDAVAKAIADSKK